MASSHSLTAAQRRILAATFEREQGFFLTGGGALVGYHLHHRTTDDLDLFTLDPDAFERGPHVLAAVASAVGGRLEVRQDAPGFRRYALEVEDGTVVVDLVLERVHQACAEKPTHDGIAVDPRTRRVFVNDRGNHRVQVFDENGKFLDQWRFGDPPSDIHLLLITPDGYLWAADRGTNKILKYGLDGRFLYSWGTWGDFPGGFWGVHGMSVDSEGNFYVAEVDSGRVQKFRPRAGTDPAQIVGGR